MGADAPLTVSSTSWKSHLGNLSMPAPSITLRPLCLSICLLVLAPFPVLASTPAALNPADIAWLRRDGFDLDAASVMRLRSMGRTGLLEAQLTERIPEQLPPAISTLLHGYPALTSSLEASLIARKQEQDQLNAMPDGDDKVAAKKAAQQAANEFGQQAQEIVMLRAVYGPNQLKEQLISFWLNHFSVYMGKGRVRWMAADYEEQVIRPHALGKFKDLVMATLKSPAMLEYLDNAQNAEGKVNENYAAS